MVITVHILEKRNEVWSDVLDVSREAECANRYVEDFADKIAEKKVFPNSGVWYYFLIGEKHEAVL